jgi:LCP family protein required for cell wall assembly
MNEFGTLKPAPAGPRRRRRHAFNGITVGVVLALGGTAGVILATNEQEAKVERVEGLDTVLTENKTGFENYLLVGSDSREGADPTDPDAGSIGDISDVQGRRSDTLMVLHVDHDNDEVGIFSIPRDLYVDIPGHGTDRVNSAYSYGEDVLIRTVQESLGIPVHHYIEVDFFGFKDIVDAIGGVEACFAAPTRDKNTGLTVPQEGCFTLNGVQGLQYARSRYFEEFVDGEWRMDPTADLGRIERQQAFIASAVARVLARWKANPLELNSIVRSVAGSVRVDPNTNLIKASNELRPLADGGLATYRLPVVGTTIDGKSVLQFDAGAERVLSYFAGTGPAPADLENR